MRMSFGHRFDVLSPPTSQESCVTNAFQYEFVDLFFSSNTVLPLKRSTKTICSLSASAHLKGREKEQDFSTSSVLLISWIYKVCKEE